eukprot:scaffold594_cov116-Isochrysis_galbana.AAC.3
MTQRAKVRAHRRPTPPGGVAIDPFPNLAASLCPGCWSEFVAHRLDSDGTRWERILLVNMAGDVLFAAGGHPALPYGSPVCRVLMAACRGRVLSLAHMCRDHTIPLYKGRMGCIWFKGAPGICKCGLGWLQGGLCSAHRGAGAARSPINKMKVADGPLADELPSPPRCLRPKPNQTLSPCHTGGGRSRRVSRQH